MSAEEKKGGGAGAIIAIIIILIIIGGIAFFMMSKGKMPVSIPGMKPPGAEVGVEMEVLPEECLMLFKFNMKKLEDPKQKDEIWDMMKQSPNYKENMEKLKTESNIDFETDIKPLIGDSMTMSVFTMPDSGAQMADGKRDTSNDHLALVVELTDAKKAADKLNELMEKAKEKFKKEDYEGTTLWIPAEEGKSMPSIAIVKNALVIGNTQDDLKKCVDASTKKGKQLKDNKKLEAILKKLPANSVISVYMDMQTMMEASKEKMAQQAPKMEEMDKFVKAMGGVGYGVAFEKGDVLGKGFVGIDKAADSAIAKALFETQPTMGVPASINLFPKDTSFYAAFDVKLLYNIIVKVSLSMPDGEKQFTQFKDEFKKNVGFDFEKDIIENLAGEAAYAFDFMELMQSVMNPAAAAGANVAAESNLKNIATALEMYSTDNKGHYPEELKELSPSYLKAIPPAPQGMQYYYEAKENPDHFMLGYSKDGEELSMDHPRFDSNTGIAGGSSASARPQRQTPPILLSLKLKDKAKVGEIVNSLVKKAGPMFKEEEHGGVKIYGAPGQFGVGIFEDFLILGTGKASATLNTIIDNKMAADKSLSGNSAYLKLKDKMKGKVLSVSIIQLEKIMPFMEMAMGMAAAQDPQSAEQAKVFLEKAKEYDSICSFSEIADDGVNFEFVVTKKAAK